MMEELIAIKKELELERAARLEAETKVRELTGLTDRLKTLIMALHTGVLVEDQNRRIILVNKEFCEIFCIPADPVSMIGWDCSESAEQTKHLFAEPDRFVEGIGTLLENRRLTIGEELWLADGRCFTRDYIPVFLDGNYQGHLWNYADVTVRKNAELLLKQREEKYTRIIENMNIGLLEVDLEGRITYANQSFCRMSGYGTDELAGVVAEDILMRDNETDRNIILDKNRERSRGIYDAYEVVVTTRNGDDKWWLISGAPVYSDDGRVNGSIGIHLDITMQKDLEKNLTEARLHAEETAYAKEVFLANMSHEIRTPMNAIHGLGRQLLKTGLDSKQESFVNAINTASDNLLVIINDILDFSKIEAGKMPIEKIGFDLRPLFRQVETILGPKAISKCLDFEIDIDQNVAPILIGDPYRINQILLNLIGNSIKFTETGKVSMMCKVIGSSQSEQELVITIEDTGIGMDQKFLENIYQKFSQENANNARKYGGTGLGMAITQQLTTLMEGTMHIESEKNRGTKVHIFLRLPIGLASDLPTRAEVHTDPEILRNKKILLVEDNPLNRLVVRTVLKIHGIAITEANNGQEAIDQMTSNRFDLILMDVQMPMMDGITATKIIRSEISGDIPIIALTANALRSELDHCIAAGMNDFVTKPFDETTLIRVLLKYLQ
jgi:PAS domain S-box-containing protein